jgi:peptide-methionine (S)-S-oxide reductase
MLCGRRAGVHIKASRKFEEPDYVANPAQESRNADSRPRLAGSRRPSLRRAGGALCQWPSHPAAVSGRAAAGNVRPGLFWGAERKFWEASGVYATAVGYAAGLTPNPTYEEVCSGQTGHNEVVMVWFDPAKISYETLLKLFWESHNPTQGMRQGNDVGTQYRSGIYTFSGQQKSQAEASHAAYQGALARRGIGAITTEILDAPAFYYAEDYHQQYLAKNPNGYCGLGGTGVSCPTGLSVQVAE